MRKINAKIVQKLCFWQQFWRFLCKKYLLESLQAYVLHGRFSVKAPIYSPASIRTVHTAERKLQSVGFKEPTVRQNFFRRAITHNGSICH